MKQKLVSLDKRRTGRVPLSKFYGKSLTDAEWRFGESESYLRSLTSRDEKAFNVLVHMFFQTLARPGHCKMSRGELGALDETSWLGKQVIISNYIQGASNCALLLRGHVDILCCPARPSPSLARCTYHMVSIEVLATVQLP